MYIPNQMTEHEIGNMMDELESQYLYDDGLPNPFDVQVNEDCTLYWYNELEDKYYVILDDDITIII